jgi:hypothetical protein
MRASPLDAVVPLFPRWLQPHFQLLQPHIDAVLRLVFAAMDDVARLLAPYMHRAVDAAMPYLQVGWVTAMRRSRPWAHISLLLHLTAKCFTA